MINVPAPGVPVLLAAGLDWLEAILPILFVGFWIVSQVFSLVRRVARGPARPPVIRVPDAARGPARPVAPGADPRVELERQIEAFLREVTGDGPAARPQPPAVGQERGRTQDRPAPPPRPRPTPSAAKPTPPAAPLGDASTPRLSAKMDRRVGALGTAPSDVARHVRDAFAHELGHLHSGLDASADAAAKSDAARSATHGATALDLVRAVRDPVTVRQAILLREILDRPVERW